MTSPFALAGDDSGNDRGGVRCGLKFRLYETSGVGDARRACVELARSIGFSELRQAEVAIIVTELATNLIKHAGSGEMLAHPIAAGGVVGVEILALDSGPGIAHIADVLRDGYSTAGTPGTGLGAVRRQAAFFDLHSTPQLGTVVLARVYAGATPPAAPVDVGLVQVPYPNEKVCGDGAAAVIRPNRVAAVVVDGLGHGVGAHDASRAALTAFHRNAAAEPAELLARLHDAMRGTRGGVAGVATITDRNEERVVTFSGMGNISATLVTHAGRRGLVSQNGTLGQTTPKQQAYTLPYPPGGVLVLHSDGLSTSWSLERYPGLLRKPAAMIAGVLYRDAFRGRDDATVLVIREVNA